MVYLNFVLGLFFMDLIFLGTIIVSIMTFRDNSLSFDSSPIFMLIKNTNLVIVSSIYLVVGLVVGRVVF